MLTITPKELASLLEKSRESIDLIDVRGTSEYAEVYIPSARNIPLHTLPTQIDEIDRTKQIIFICRSGARSSQACMFAENAGIKAYNLTGGMNAFESEFPQKIIHGEKKKLFGLL